MILSIMDRRIRIRLTGVVLLVALSLSAPLAIAKSFSIDVSEQKSWAVKKHKVISLRDEEAKIFKDANIDREYDETTGEEIGLTIGFDRKPKSLESVEKGWFIVAGITRNEKDWRHRPSSSERFIEEHGLLAKIIHIYEEDDRWTIKLEHASLEEVIEEGKIYIRVYSEVVSGDDDFFGTEPEWRFVRTSAADRGIDTCDISDDALRFERQVPLGENSKAKITYAATMALNKELKFAGGRLVEAEFHAEICQDAKMHLEWNNPDNRLQGSLWKRSSRPKLFWVGWLPILVEARSSLGYSLEAESRFKMDPMFGLSSRVSSGVVLVDGQWTPGKFEEKRELIPGKPASSIKVTSGLTPRLDLILYGTGGFFIEANAGASLFWNHGEKDVAGKLEPALFAGLSYRLKAGAARWKVRKIKLFPR